ncbi:MAG: glycerophosphodiester phosphodiesterase family protein, partial [Alphaproteobacteria bacterium]
MRHPDFKFPTIVGHRGVTETGPENTLAGIARAAEEGATWVEFDVQLSGDEIPLVIHDDTLERTTNGTGRMIDQKADALTKLDAGSWFDAQYTGQKIPTFLEVLALCDDLNLGMNIEIKPGDGDHAKTTAAMLENLKHYG